MKVVQSKRKTHTNTYYSYTLCGRALVTLMAKSGNPALLSAVMSPFQLQFLNFRNQSVKTFWIQLSGFLNLASSIVSSSLPEKPNAIPTYLHRDETSSIILISRDMSPSSQQSDRNSSNVGLSSVSEMSFNYIASIAWLNYIISW